MTLDEAIKHAEEVADGHDRIKQIKAVTLEECKRAEEHRQLANWLKELKQLREQTRGVPVSERPPEKDKEVLIYIGQSPYLATYEDGEWETEYFTVDPEYEPKAWFELPKPYKEKSEIHCNYTDAEIAKSFIEDVEAVKDLLPKAERGKE